MLFKVKIDRSQPQYFISTEVNRNIPWRQVSSGIHMVHMPSVTKIRTKLQISKHHRDSKLVSIIEKIRYWVIRSLRVKNNIVYKHFLWIEVQILFGNKPITFADRIFTKMIALDEILRTNTIINILLVVYIMLWKLSAIYWKHSIAWCIKFLNTFDSSTVPFEYY